MAKTFFNRTSNDASPFEPKRQFRWILNFAEVPDVTFMAKVAKKPSFTQDAEEHNYLNHTFKFPTKVKWEPIDVTVIDSFQADMGSDFWNVMKAMGYQLPESTVSAAQGITKRSAVAAIGGITIKQLDGGEVDTDGNPMGANVKETWTLINPFITSIKWGDALDYGNNGLVEVGISIAYDYADYVKHTGFNPYI
tara:strand:- start:90 stop:671 length:582 start_codon:yes stop_codon:yes gene_type:complete